MLGFLLKCLINYPLVPILKSYYTVMHECGINSFLNKISGWNLMNACHYAWSQQGDIRERGRTETTGSCCVESCSHFSIELSAGQKERPGNFTHKTFSFIAELRCREVCSYTYHLSLLLTLRAWLTDELLLPQSLVKYKPEEITCASFFFFFFPHMRSLSAPNHFSDGVFLTLMGLFP